MEEDEILSDVKQIELQERASEEMAQDVVKQNINVIINKSVLFNNYIKEESHDETSPGKEIILTLR